MAKTEKKPKEPKETLTLADNPSLIKAGEEIHLRVLDDFNIEQDLPKWKRFKSDWEKLKTELKLKWDSDAEAVIKKLEDPKQQEEYMKRLQAHKKGQKKIDDDKWHIREKHEESVANSLQKTIRLAPGRLPIKDRLLIKLGIKKQPVPVEVAFEDLKSHMLHTTTEEMAKKRAILDTAEKQFRDLGQYTKADQLKAYKDQIVEEQALVDAGFNIYVTEQMMIDFITKSERGVMVDFLRYYEGIIPDDVADLKKKADEAMIFDNYVVAYYSDIKKVAKETENKQKAKEAEKVIKKRRDPILFGLIKESRKLHFIADWVTPEDDLTLSVIEEALGQKGLKLDDPTQPDPTVSTYNSINSSSGSGSPSNNTANVMREIRDMVQDAVDYNLYTRHNDSNVFIAHNDDRVL